MRKLLVVLVCAVALLATATASEAKIFVNISDGTNPTINALASTTVPFFKGNLKLSQASSTRLASGDQTDTLTLIQCTTPRPCALFIPSGASTQQPGDTFKISDVSATALAKVTALDKFTGGDRVSFSGVRFTSLGTNKVLTVTYGTQTGDLRTLTSAEASSYVVSSAFSGHFKTLAGLRATACKVGTVATDMDQPEEACVRLSMALNGTGVDGQGNPASATIAVACNNLFPTVNPCGTNGSWTASTGTFNGVNDGRSISCPSGCSPAQVATLTGRFNGANETLQLTTSLNGFIANVTDENGGVEEAAIGLADEVALNRWVTTSAKNERCKAVAKAPTTNDTRNVTNKSTLPISFEYWCGTVTAAGAEGIPLVSLADTALIPGAAGAKYSASRETFLPTQTTQDQLQFKQIQTLTLTYDVVVGTETDPTDTRLPPVTYSDCRDRSIRLEIQLMDSSGADKGIMTVNLGTTTVDNFKNGCNAFAGFVDIRNNQDARVDASQLALNNPPACCSKFTDLQNGTIGNLIVRKIAFIVSRPVSPVSDPPENYGVRFFDGNVNGITALSSLQVVTNFVRVTPTSTNGVSIAITKLDGVGAGVVKVIPSSEIVINGGKFTTSASINDIVPESGASYAVSLCPNGTEQNDPNLAENTVLGICIADQARFTLL